MSFTRFSLSLIPLIFLTFFSCKSSQEVQKVQSTDSKPEVVVETTAAIVGGLEVLQKELKYPQKARNEGIETVLIADVLVNKNGDVEQISFEKETKFGFEAAAENALREVEFKAGERNGEPVNMYITIPIKFEL